MFKRIIYYNYRPTFLYNLLFLSKISYVKIRGINLLNDDFNHIYVFNISKYSNICY